MFMQFVGRKRSAPHHPQNNRLGVVAPVALKEVELGGHNLNHPTPVTAMGVRVGRPDAQRGIAPDTAAAIATGWEGGFILRLVRTG